MVFKVNLRSLKPTITFFLSILLLTGVSAWAKTDNWLRMSNREPDKVLTKIDSIFKEVPQLSKAERAYWLFIQGNAYYNAQESTSAVRVLQESLNLYTILEADSMKAVVSKKLADQYDEIGLFYKAIERYLDVVVYYETRKDSLKIAATQLSLGTAYMISEDNERAEEYMLQALSYFQRANQTEHIAGCYSNLAALYSRNDDLVREKEYLEKALELFEQIEAFGPYMGAINNLAIYYERIGQHEMAVEYLKKAAKGWEQLGDVQWLTLAELNLANNLIKLGQLDSARYYLDKGKAASVTIGSKILLVQAYDYESRYFEALNQPGKALSTYRQYVDLHDSLLDLEMQEDRILAEVKYETAKVENDLQVRDQELALAKVEHELMEFQQKMALLAIVFVLLLSFVLYKRQGLKRKNDQLIHQANIDKYENEQRILEYANNEKSRQLTSYTMQLIQQKERIRALLNEINALKDSSDNDETERTLASLKKRIEKQENLSQNWEEFSLYFESVHKDFFKILKQRFPNLTNKELRLCAFLRMNLSTKEIAELLNLSQKAIETARYRLRKKMELESSVNVVDFIISVT